jgi:DNA helicase II / ATP-dependent DNA helicase PcrA
MKKSPSYERLYKGLNKAQKEAVDTIEGPVMVIAGPGTGKTQVIALRIGNILSKTDTPADGILCLTFTNSGVHAMKKRLLSYGIDTSKILVSTFHAFGSRLIEEFYHHLDLSEPPKTLDEADAVSLVDDVLSENEWEHLRPRGDAARYFRDLKSLVSILIRERMSPEDFAEEIEHDIHALKNDPDNRSSRGATKGELKSEVKKKIESLEKAREAVAFYRLYEEKKKEQNVYDYDDILRAMVRLVTESEDVRATLRERHLYVLVDEHQDSSGVQNEFLKKVWGPVEKPNVFVVGDDRQLIYGFSGASLSLFEEFRENFSGTKLVTLTENYRSTQRILDTADTLLKSPLAQGKLISNRDGDHPILLSECAYERDEILRAAIFFKEKLQAGLAPEECALLVPKNFQVRTALRILKDQGLMVSAPGSTLLFETAEYGFLMRMIKLMDNPNDSVETVEALLDPLSGVSHLETYSFLRGVRSKDLSVEKLQEKGFAIGEKAAEAVLWSKGKSAYEVVQYTGAKFLLEGAESHKDFVRRVEVVRSLLHLALSLEERNRQEGGQLKHFIRYIERLREYGEDVPLAVFGEEKGIRVMTLHRSKGLEFEAVWIAHLTERSLMSGKRLGLTLPERLKILEEKKDETAARREVYVAITRAKHYAALSYALSSHAGGDEELSRVVDALPKAQFIFETKEESERKLHDAGLLAYVLSQALPEKPLTRAELKVLIKEEFVKKSVSATTLNSFFECPWKWYFRDFLGVPEAVSETLVFGSVVHGAIENILKSGSAKPKALDDAVEEALDYHRVSDGKTRRRMKSDALRSLKRFADDLLPGLYEERESERALSGKDKSFPELTFSGKIDLMEHDGGGGVRVTDFKTGRPRTAKEIEKLDKEERLSTYLRQLAMYDYLLRIGTKGKYEVEKSRLYFVEGNDEDSLYETALSDEHRELLLKDIRDYRRELLDGEWMERECHHKAFPGERNCPYCERAKMYQ